MTLNIQSIQRFCKYYDFAVHLRSIQMLHCTLLRYIACLTVAAQYRVVRKHNGTGYRYGTLPYIRGDFSRSENQSSQPLLTSPNLKTKMAKRRNYC